MSACYGGVRFASALKPLHARRAQPGSSFHDFEHHLKTNCVGPITTAQKLIRSRLPIGMLVFMSSDSSSASRFLSFEDGSGLLLLQSLFLLKDEHSFAAYASSKAALNQALRVGSS